MFYRPLFALTSALLLVTSFPSYLEAQTISQVEESSNQTSSISPQKLALIEQLLSLTNSAEITEKMLQSILSDSIQNQMIDSIIASSGITDEAEIANIKSKTSKITSRFYELMLEKIDWQKTINDIIIPLYDKYFTAAELQDLIDFYQTSTGQKTLTVLPQLMQESMVLYSQKITPQLMEIMQQVVQEEMPQISN